jgi:hypothetical protein
MQKQKPHKTKLAPKLKLTEAPELTPTVVVCLTKCLEIHIFAGTQALMKYGKN